MTNFMDMTRIDLPNDGVIEILLWLPVRSLLRFKSVCKYWSSLIDESDFAVRHHERSKEYLLVYSYDYRSSEASHSLLCHETRSVVAAPNLELPELSGIRFPCLFRPYNGIFCIEGLNLWNPATKELKALPPPQCQCPSSPPGNCRDCKGYGFDFKTNDFKMVIMHYPCNTDLAWNSHPHLLAQVYSFKSDSWSEIDAVNVLPSRAIYVFTDWSDELYIEGMCFWVVEVEGTEVMILSFDLHSEVFATTPFPDGYNVRGYWLVEYWVPDWVFVLNGCIALLDPLCDENIDHYEIWVLNEIGNRESWTKLYKFGPCPFPDLTLPLGNLKDDELFRESEEGGGGELVWRQPLDPTVGRARAPDRHIFSRVFHYKESLFKLDRGKNI